jgi:hypothetical protein
MCWFKGRVYRNGCHVTFARKNTGKKPTSTNSKQSGMLAPPKNPEQAPEMFFGTQHT